MAEILYLGTHHGVVTLRRDNGSPWRTEHQGLRDWDVPAVAAVPGSPERVLAATRGDGVWLSEDGGQRWKKPCYGKPGPGKVHCLAFDPRNPTRIFAGCEPIDVFVSDDLGRRWERLASVRELPWIDSIDYPVPTVEPHVRDITIDPTDPRTIYVALQVGHMIKSTDGGATWQLLNRDLDADVHTIVVDPTATDQIVVATGGHDCRAGVAKGRALYRSLDGGVSWSPVGAEFSQEYSVPLVVSPSDPRVMYAALANGQPGQWRRPTGAESVLVRTADGGSTWERLELGLPELSKDFPEALAVAAGDADQVYAAFRGGEVLSSDDAGRSWAQLDVRVPAAHDIQHVAA
jgi:photosystem II stability/assembly factor-like uncharacterized protein